MLHPQFDESIGSFRTAEGLVNLSPSQSYWSMHSLLTILEEGCLAGKAKEKVEITDVVWQSRIMRMVKQEKEMDQQELFDTLRRGHGLNDDYDMFLLVLKKLAELGLIKWEESSSVKYIP